jgi:hypothetical protein
MNYQRRRLFIRERRAALPFGNEQVSQEARGYGNVVFGTGNLEALSIQFDAECIIKRFHKKILQVFTGVSLGVQQGKLPAK